MGKDTSTATWLPFGGSPMKSDWLRINSLIVPFLKPPSGEYVIDLATKEGSYADSAETRAELSAVWISFLTVPLNRYKKNCSMALHTQ